MLNKGEASMGCLHVKDSSHSLQCNGNLSHEFSKSKNKSNVFSRQHVWEPERSLSSKFFAPPNEVYYRPMHQQGFHFLSAYHLPHIQKAQQDKMHIPESHFHPMNNDYYFPMHTHFQHKPFVVSSQSFPKDFQFQDFQYFVVIDFEATCEKEKHPHPQEIIEFPSVIVNSMTGQLEDSFQIYVRPTCNQLLSDFCKELTGIQQVQVDKGVLLSEALLMHDKWLEEKGIKHTNFAVVTWSNWDCRIMLESECRFKRIRKPPYFNRWINLKVPFHEVFGGARCNLKEAVQLAGLVWEGRAHCGLDDAKNTARLLTLLMHRGFRFSITNSLLRQAADGLFGAWHFPNCPSSPTLRLPQSRLSSVDGDLAQQHHSYCYCGVRSYRQMVQRAGVEHGRFFFGCGNWTAARGAVCPYFEWASP